MIQLGFQSNVPHSRTFDVFNFCEQRKLVCFLVIILNSCDRYTWESNLYFKYIWEALYKVSKAMLIEVYIQILNIPKKMKESSHVIGLTQNIPSFSYRFFVSMAHPLPQTVMLKYHK